MYIGKALLVQYQIEEEKGQPEGIATLDQAARLEESQIPFYVVRDENYVHTDANFTVAEKNRLATLEKNVANGVAGLDSNAKIMPQHIPDISLISVNEVSGEMEQLALSAQSGDIVVRSDLSKTFIHNGGNSATMLDWTEFRVPSVADNSHNHIIDNITGLQLILDGKSNTGHGHAIADITGLQTELNNKALSVHGHTMLEIAGLSTALDGKISIAEKGVANGVATLDETGIIPAAQLPIIPSDSIVEVATFADLPTVGESGKLYVVIETDDLYRWNGTGYSNITAEITSVESANKLTTARTITIDGGVTGSVSFDGSADVILTSTLSVHAHAISDVTDLQTTLDGKALVVHDHAISDITDLQTTLDGKIASTEKGVANGVATLDANGLVPAAQLPVITSDEEVLEFADLVSFPATGESSKLYIAMDTNDLYRWDGTAYVNMTTDAGTVASADALTTARLISLDGGVTGSVSFDGSTDVTLTTTLSAHAHAISDVTDLQTTLDGKADSVHAHAISDVTDLQTTLNSKIASTEKGVANGVATLDANGLVPAAQLPSYVDDVIEVASAIDLPATGESGKIYVTLDTNTIHRWSGTQYIEISASVSSADTANTLATARNITLNGDVSGSALFDGSADITITSAVADDSHNHTISTLTGLQTALDAKVDDSEKGVANGIATLDTNGFVPLTQLPSSVDDVLEFDTVSNLPATGAAGKIYVTTDTNLQYRWDGSAYSLLNSNNALTANKLTTARNFTYNGDISGSGSFDGSADATISLTLGNVATAGTYAKVTVDAKGRVTSGTELSVSDIPDLPNPTIKVDKQLYGTVLPFALGKVIAVDATGKFILAQANSLSTSNVIGIVIDEDATYSANGAWVIAVDGLFTVNSATNLFTPGSTYYLSATVAGDYTDVEPTTVGNVIRPVFTGVDLNAANTNSGILADSVSVEITASDTAQVSILNTDLVTNVYTFNHALGQQLVDVSIFDNNFQNIVIPQSAITYTDGNNLNIDFANINPTFTGTWVIKARK